MKKFRMLDYIIFFTFPLILTLLNIAGTNSIIGAVVASVIISIFVSFIFGTITNVVFKNKSVK